MQTRRRLAFAIGLLALCAAGPAAALERMRMCPMIWRPVCAVTHGGHHKTFGNRCLAEAEHAWIRHEGECRRGRR